jgi:phosphate transport system substrate-binding protein
MVSQLTLKQLESIFTGKISNWKDVGGSDTEIVIYSRQTSSGTYDFFKEHILSDKKFTATALLMPATGAIAQSVSQEVNAIGYVGLAYLDKSVKPISISADNGSIFVAPSVETVKNKTYPISRPLYYIYPDSLKDAISPFVEFVLSVTGQKLVVKTGYVPVK